MDSFYAAPVAGDFRQGDIYRDAISVSLTTNDPPAIRSFVNPKTGRETLTLHRPESPPNGGFNWGRRERVEAEGKKAYCIVLSHDCEIENDDDEHYRHLAILRPFAALGNEDDRRSLLEHRHFGKLYLPSDPESGFPESYADLRAITTVRQNALPASHRVLGLSDDGRVVLQEAVAAFFTEKSDPAKLMSQIPRIFRSDE